MKSKKPLKFKKIRLDLFQEVNFEMKSADSALLFLIYAVVFGLAFFVGGQVMTGYDEKNAQMFHEGSALAAETPQGDITGLRENFSLESGKISKTMLGAADSAKDLASRAARAKKLARQRSAETALINNAPVLSGRTKKMPSGKRTCPVKSEHPQRGGKLHVDEDCCADYNEYPNPRCYYSPEKMSILQKK